MEELKYPTMTRAGLLLLCQSLPALPPGQSSAFPASNDMSQWASSRSPEAGYSASIHGNGAWPGNDALDALDALDGCTSCSHWGAVLWRSGASTRGPTIGCSAEEGSWHGILDCGWRMMTSDGLVREQMGWTISTKNNSDHNITMEGRRSSGKPDSPCRWEKICVCSAGTTSPLSSNVYPAFHGLALFTALTTALSSTLRCTKSHKPAERLQVKAVEASSPGHRIVGSSPLQEHRDGNQIKDGEASLHTAPPQIVPEDCHRRLDAFFVPDATAHRRPDALTLCGWTHRQQARIEDNPVEDKPLISLFSIASVMRISNVLN